MRPDRIVTPSSALDHNFGMLQCVKDLAIQPFVSEPTSVTPIERIASATGVPCATTTSTWRSFAMIPSGVCRFFCIVMILLGLTMHTSGRTISTGVDTL